MFGVGRLHKLSVQSRFKRWVVRIGNLILRHHERPERTGIVETAGLADDHGEFAFEVQLLRHDRAAMFGPESDGFTATGALNTRRGFHTATVLADGTVLMVGGTELSCYSSCRGTGRGERFATILSSAELFK